MKVILLKDVAKIGRRFEVVEVPDGYAMNKLIPQSAAEPATSDNLKKLQAKNSKIESDNAVADEHFASVVEALKGKEVKLEQAANDNGGLFEAVKTEALAEVVSKETGIKVPVEYFNVNEAIKTVGEHTVELKHGEAKTEFKLVVEAK